jgi:hypothetical protein
MEVGVVLSPRVLLGDARAGLDVGADGLAEWLVVGQTGLVERLQLERSESLPLLVRDLQVAVHIDHVLKTKLTGEAVRATEKTPP